MAICIQILMVFVVFCWRNYFVIEFDHDFEAFINVKDGQYQGMVQGSLTAAMPLMGCKYLQ